MDTLYVGIDISSKNNVVYLMKPGGSKHSSFSVCNNPDGAAKIVDRVTSVLLALNIPKVVIGMEDTSVYGDNLMYFLRESGSLGCFEKHLPYAESQAGQQVQRGLSGSSKRRLY